ncbi:aldehyde-activating protein [Mesorhizobium sp. CGMCC 1.15528]|uniref:Aldehyde-activating protein n=1 Tax=Mesorhizobium zhangyense TaxID=1776730 RepID=A0A7C9V4E5_9HYPH|nr:aldehyde-activating protein [Mesorhizobium zhangyense]NGN40144.1 aldehyde-activating protein [Mesorhizobium zhangyense]
MTHWAAGGQVGVNVRLMAPEVLARAKVRHFDGADTWKDLDD